MARVVKVFRTLRNHWEKSTFAVCVLSYGGHWLYGKHSDNVLRREACIEARAFGHQLIGPQEHLKKATVILNPAACKGKANHLFEKNAAPILHLAGMEVKIVKTDYEGQAKKLMELMDQTDMLIIAGGDGTLQEVITGLLRRADEETFKPPKDPEPERWENKDISTLELTVSTHNKNPVKRREADSMLITLDPDSLTAGQFITEGTKKALNPMESVENALQIEASAACLSLPEEGVGFYDIDNEAYEAMSVEVRLLPRKLRFFCSAERREQLAQAQ